MAMLFIVPVVWREPSNHSSDCYFYLTLLVASGMNRMRQRIYYINIPSTIRCAPHGGDLPATKRIQFEFGDGRGRHGENRGRGCCAQSGTQMKCSSTINWTC